MLNIPEVVKELLKQDGVKKNFRVHFPNGEHEDITNENLVSESVKFTESLCSQSDLKFGLCESSQLTFETFGIDNISGCTIDCYFRIHGYDNAEIPLGRFIVDSSKKQRDMSRRTVVAYSDYLNNPSRNKISEIEKAKWITKFASALAIEYNPIFLAIANVSEYIDMDMSVFDKSDISNELLSGSNYVMSVSFGARGGSSKNVICDISYKKLNINASNYANSNDLMLAYTQDAWNTTEDAIRSSIKSVIDSTGISNIGITGNEEDAKLQQVISWCKTHARTYDRSGTLYTPTEYVLKETDALFSPYFQSQYGMELFFPYKVDIKNESNTVVQSIKFKNDSAIKLYKINPYNGTLKIPKVPLSKQERSIKSGGVYSADVSQMPDSVEMFRSLLEINGLFLTQDKTNGKYYFRELFNPTSGFLFPELENLYPGTDGGNSPKDVDIIVKPSILWDLWYDDCESDPYKIVTCQYTDINGSSSAYTVESCDIYNKVLLRNLQGYGERVLTINVELNEASKICVQGDFDVVTLYDKSGSVLYSAGESGNPVSETVIKAQNYDVYKLGVKKTTIAGGEDFVNADVYIATEYKDGRFKTYNLSDNMIFKNCNLEPTEVKKICDELHKKIKDIQYSILDMESIGLPYVEAGDSVSVETDEGEKYTIILNRTLNGIQSLKDSITSNF